MPEPVVVGEPLNHARIHGTPASLKALIQKMRPVNGRLMARYGELRRLHDRYDEVLAGTREGIIRRYDEPIAVLAGELARLEKEQAGGAGQEIRGSGGDGSHTEAGAERGLSSRIRSRLVPGPGNPAGGPAAENARQRERIRQDIAQLVKTRDELIRAECGNVRQSFEVLQKNPDLFSRAGDDDLLLGFLAGLSAGFHVFCDLSLPEGQPDPRKTRGDPGPECRIDLVIAGPPGVFLADTRDGNRPGGMPREVRVQRIRAAHGVLARYFRKNCPDAGEIPIRNLIITAGRSPEDSLQDPGTEIVAPDELAAFLSSRGGALSRHQLDSVIGLLSRL